MQRSYCVNRRIINFVNPISSISTKSSRICLQRIRQSGTPSKRNILNWNSDCSSHGNVKMHTTHPTKHNGHYDTDSLDPSRETLRRILHETRKSLLLTAGAV